MHDIASLEERGVPGAFVASQPFEDAATAQGRSLGFAPLAVYVPHPIQDRTDDEMVEIAEDAFEQVVVAICTPDALT